MLNWYTNLAEMIDLRSFSNLWYWIALAAFWTLAGRRVVGVPVDLLARAHAEQGEPARRLDTLAALQAGWLVERMERSGPLCLAAAAFGLTLAAILGFGYGLELGQAAFLLLLPLALLRAMDVASARRIAAGASGEALQRLMFWHRFRVQVLGLVSGMVTVLWGMWQNITLGALGP